MINTEKKKVRRNFCKPVGEWKALIKNGGRNNDIKRISQQPKFADKENGERRPRFLS